MKRLISTVKFLGKEYLVYYLPNQEEDPRIMENLMTSFSVPEENLNDPYTKTFGYISCENKDGKPVSGYRFFKWEPPYKQPTNVREYYYFSQSFLPSLDGENLIELGRAYALESDPCALFGVLMGGVAPLILSTENFGGLIGQITLQNRFFGKDEQKAICSLLWQSFGDPNIALPINPAFRVDELNEIKFKPYHDGGKNQLKGIVSNSSKLTFAYFYPNITLPGKIHISLPTENPDLNAIEQLIYVEKGGFTQDALKTYFRHPFNNVF